MPIRKDDRPDISMASRTGPRQSDVTNMDSRRTPRKGIA